MLEGSMLGKLNWKRVCTLCVTFLKVGQKFLQMHPLSLKTAISTQSDHKIDLES